jgi:uncharacterized oligopeptide transporter (OPT) family protein
MSDAHRPSSDVRSAADRVGVKPVGLKEFTPRAVICGLLVAVVMGASYPYVVLKLGFGPNVSVVAAFFGYLALGLFGRNSNRFENNLVQTAGTAAAQAAFMCVLLAAFDMLAARPGSTLAVTLSPLQSFAWLTTAGLLGVLLAVPMRQHFVVDEKLAYPDGVAAAETVIALDGEGADAKRAARALGLAGLASAAVMLMTEDAHILNWFSSVTLVGTAVTMASGVGINWSLLSLGSGMLVGLRINLSMLLGVAVGWILVPYALLSAGLLAPTFNRNDVLLWSMWPATGMLIASGLTSLALKWDVLVRTFTNLSARSDDQSFPVRWTIIGILLSGLALVVVQKVSLGLDIWITLVAILLSVPLMLVGLRVLGETNWGPVSQLSNTMQAIFGAIVPGNLTANMLASGTTGTIAVVSEGLMQDYKAGHMIGSTPRHLTIMQLVGTPVGAAAVSWMYPLLRSTYGIVGEQAGLASPISRRIAGFAEILAQGVSALPAGAVPALIVGALLGIAIAVLESRRVRGVPSATGIGIGMMVPAAVIIVMCIGGFVEHVWRRISPRSYELFMPPVASGFIAGEALIAVLIPLLVILGIVHVG